MHKLLVGESLMYSSLALELILNTIHLGTEATMWYAATGTAG